MGVKVSRRAPRVGCSGAWAMVLMLVLAVAQDAVNAESRARHRPSATTAQPPLSTLSLPFALPKGATATTQCPATDAAWRAWASDKVQELLTLRTPPRDNQSRGHREHYLDVEQVMERSQDLADFIAACQSVRPMPPDLDNLRNFTAVQRNANYQSAPPDQTYPHQFGHSVTDREYLDVIGPQVELPCLLQSPRFLQALNTLRDGMAWQMIQDQNQGREVNGCRADGRQWQTLLYRSQYLGTPDDSDTLGRFLVIVPASDDTGHDQWIQFGILVPRGKAVKGERPRNVSVVSVVRRNAPADKFDAIVDWYRCREHCPKSGTVRFRYDVTNMTGNCQECHKMMPLSIHPSAVYDGKLTALPATAAASAVAAVNERIVKEYRRLPRIKVRADDDLADPRHYGPPIGAAPEEFGLAGRERNSATVAACAPWLPKASRPFVAEAMNCGECHSNANRSQRGALNYPVATEKRRSDKLAYKLEGAQKVLDLAPNLVQRTILQGVMPPPHKLARVLTIPERHALYQCLSKEYFQPALPKSVVHPAGQPARGLFVDWLLHKGDQPPPTLIAATRPMPEADHLFSHALFAAAAPTVANAARCLKCHNAGPSPHPDGPSLLGVVGRRAASTEFADYSAELRELGEAGLVWDETSLMEFLRSPDEFVRTRTGRPDAQSAMLKSYPDAALRQQMVEYLKSLK